VALSNRRGGGSFHISTFRATGICPSTVASWPNSHLRIRCGTRTPGALRFCPFWKSVSDEFRSISKRFTPSLEYYGDWEPLPAFEPFVAQMHQILPGGDIRLRKNIIWSLGVGVGITPATHRIVYKSRLEFSFGEKARH
jgi:hypothetical protein